MNEELLGQMGLILTQLRYARRAIEDIERSTARYNSFAFASALSAGPRFGEPPMFNGALKVYINNIHDLEPGGGIGSLIQGILGGIGAFTGNLIGGIPGGFLAGLAVPDMFAQLSGAIDRIQQMIADVRAIMDRVGSRDTPASATANAANQASGTASGTSMPTLLRVIDSFTALFTAASGGSGNEMAQSLQSVDQRVRPLLTSINQMLDGLLRVINGLILLVPILSGAIASLIVRIDDIKIAIVEALQLVLRTVFLIRGVVFVTIYDTLSAIARMGAGLLSTLGTAVERILASAFSIAGSVLSLVITGLRFVASAIERTVNSLLPWVVNTVDTVLAVVARSPIFGLLAHIVRMLPSLLPALNQVLNGPTATLSNQADLDRLAREPLPVFTTGLPGGTGTPAPFAPLPDLANLTLPQPAIDALTAAVRDASANVAVNVRAGVDGARDALTRVGEDFARAAGPGELANRAEYQRRLRGVRSNADALANALEGARAQAEASGNQHGALREIATAYEGWLTGGGLRDLVGQINTALGQQPTTGPDAARGILGQIVATAGARAVIPPRAVIDIDNIEIILAPPPPQPAPGPRTDADPRGGDSRLALRSQLEHQHDLEERGITLDPGAAYFQVPA